jgi:hypothetical protein
MAWTRTLRRLRDRIGAVICNLPEYRWPEVREAMLVACGFQAEPALLDERR